MTDFKVTYFDFHGGRGEPIRIALHAAGMEYEDVRWSFKEFGEKRGSLRFNAVPTLELDDRTITQSNAISRYIGKMAGLYPSDAIQALYCDEVMDALEDLNHYMVQTFGLEGEDLKNARKTFMDGRLTTFTKGLEECLIRGGGKYFADSRLTVADLKMLTMLQSLRSGKLDHIPIDFIDMIAPAFVEYQNRIEQSPEVQTYYASTK